MGGKIIDSGVEIYKEKNETNSFHYFLYFCISIKLKK